MLLPSPFPIKHLLAAQCIVIALIMAALPFYPPAVGRMLIVPMSTHGAAGLLAGALASGAQLIDRGPLPGSLVVEGDHAALAATLGAVIILAAPQSGCGRRGVPG